MNEQEEFQLIEDIWEQSQRDNQENQKDNEMMNDLVEQNSWEGI